MTFGGVSSVPVPVNYVADCFKRYPQELGASLNTYRLVLGLALPFFINTWSARVGIDWVYDTQAFVTIFAFGIIVLLMWKGHVIRGWSLIKADEEDDEEDAMGHSVVGH